MDESAKQPGSSCVNRAPDAPWREVSNMEGLFLQSVPGVGSLVGGILLLAVAVAAVVYGWVHEKPAHATAEREPLKKAA